MTGDLAAKHGKRFVLHRGTLHLHSFWSRHCSVWRVFKGFFTLSAPCPFAHGLKGSSFLKAYRMDLWKRLHIDSWSAPCPFEETLWKWRSNSAHQRLPGALRGVLFKKCIKENMKAEFWRILSAQKSNFQLTKSVAGLSQKSCRPALLAPTPVWADVPSEANPAG